MKIQLQKCDPMEDIDIGDFIVFPNDCEVLMVSAVRDKFALINMTTGYSWYSESTLDDLISFFKETEGSTQYRIVKKDKMILQEDL